MQDEHCGSDISASDTQVEPGSVYPPSYLDVDHSISNQSVHRPWSIDVDHSQHAQSVHQSTCIGVDHVMHDLHSSGSQLVATSVPDPLQGQILLDSNDETLTETETEVEVNEDSSCLTSDIESLFENNINDNLSVQECLNKIHSLSESIDRKTPMEESLQHLIGKTFTGRDCETNQRSHKACVCVICDRFIKGTNTVKFVSSQQLRRHSHVLDVEFFNNCTNNPINDTLRKQYRVDDEELKDLLLSPRSTKTNDGYMCCNTCYTFVARKNSDETKPPKDAISNGNAIGSIPTNIVENISEVLAASIARVRTLSYVFNYFGGAHKAIKGSHMFFVNDPEFIGATFNHIIEGTQKSVYTMITGRVTPNQRTIVKRRCAIETDKYKNLLRFFIHNHPSYRTMSMPEECPQPTVIGGFTATRNNEDAEEEPSVENNIECTTFRFAPRTQSSTNTGPFSNENDFIVSKLMNKNIDFTLLFKYGTKIQAHLLDLIDMFPVQFPFGRGGPREKRAVKMSAEYCYKHYAALSLPQMMRADFLLIICSMYQTAKCYTNAIITCRSTLNKSTVGNEVSKLTHHDLQIACNNLNNGDTQENNTVRRLFSSVSGACENIGQSNEAAKVARKKYFSMWHLFGSPAIFFTVSPCDECSFRVRLYANSNQCHHLPSTEDIMNVEDCVADFEFRKQCRAEYPGACAHEFENIMQVVKEVLIGWKSGKGTNGIFGVPIAFADSVEEQARYTLHSHICVWIKDFNTVRQFMFHSNSIIRDAARKEMLKYFKQTLFTT